MMHNPIGLYRDLKLIYSVNFQNKSLQNQVSGLGRLVLNHLFRYYDAPVSLLIAVTGRCQCRCKHCGVSYLNSPARLSSRVIRKVAREYRELGGVRIIYSGGEPLLREDLVELVSFSTELGLTTFIDSNGIAYGRSLAAALKHAGLDNIEFSIDSMDERFMESNRGCKGILATVKKAMETARAAGQAFSVNTVAFRENLEGGLDDVIAFSRAAGAKYVRILEPISAGLAPGGPARLDGSERGLMQTYFEPGFVMLEQVGRFTSDCSGINGRYLSIAPDGTVTPCPYMPIPLGNVLDRSLADIIRDTKALFSRMKQCSPSCEAGTCIVNDDTFRRRFLGDPAGARDGK